MAAVLARPHPLASAPSGVGQRRVVSLLLACALVLADAFEAGVSSAFPFGSIATYPVSHVVRKIAVGDFNRDGKLDVVAVTWAGPSVGSVMLGRGDGTLLPAVDYPAAQGASGVAVG